MARGERASTQELQITLERWSSWLRILLPTAPSFLKIAEILDADPSYEHGNKHYVLSDKDNSWALEKKILLCHLNWENAAG